MAQPIQSSEESADLASETSDDETVKKPTLDVLQFVDAPNLVDQLDEKTLTEIQKEVSDGFDIDMQSRAAWEEKTKKAMDLANQTWSQKNFPFTNASNIKYPLISTAATQFAARAYPNFIKGTDVVKGMVVGEDPEGIKAARAYRVGQHMSYQLLQEMKEWEEDTDKLLTNLPIVGCAFKKTYYDSALKRNVSCFKHALDVVINYWAKSMETAPRISEVFTLYPNEIIERIRTGVYVDFDFGQAVSTKEGAEEGASSSHDPAQPHVFIEQHGFFDLDQDGYREPYIFVLHKDSQKIVRVTARFRKDGIERNEQGEIYRIQPTHYYTKFSFLPSPDGSIYDSGFGSSLGPLNHAINSILNQLIDSGTLYNLNSGFIGKGIQLNKGKGGGEVEFKLGEWKHVNFVGEDIRSNIMPLPFKEPSAVLFNLLGYLVTAAERYSSVTEILTGDQSNQAERPTTTLERVKQGMMVFNSIYKRLYRQFREEFRKLFELNAYYLNPMDYFRILDIAPPELPPPPPGSPPQLMQYAQAVAHQKMMSIPREDYDYRSCDVVPVADPNELTSTEKIMKAQTLMSMRGMGLNDQAALQYMVEALQIPEPKKYLQAPPPPPNPEIILKQEELQLKKDMFAHEMLKYQIENPQRQAELGKTIAEAEKILADAEAVEAGPQLDVYKAQLKAVVDQWKTAHKGVSDAESGLGRVAKPPRDQGVDAEVGGVPQENSPEPGVGGFSELPNATGVGGGQISDFIGDSGNEV